jgi:uncharacterized PurR-regulated membrane protein YhhQ (DUF165 family)
VFITLAFLGTIPSAGLISAIVAQWLTKSVYEAVATPITYIIVNWLKKSENLDVYDKNTNFSPVTIR